MKKRLVGGDFLLDVSSIELEETSTLTNITDKDVISQLTNLKKFIPNPSMIKPIWVKLLDNDGKLVVARGSLSVVDADEFELDVILNGYTLKIHVKFTQVLNEDDDPIDDWYIATNDAKYLFTTNNFATFKVADVKNIDGEILSQLKCGDIIIKEDASGEHAYIVTYRGETGICLTYTDAYAVETQSYDLVDEWVYNSEDKSVLNSLEQIYDKDGHNRFIEGEIDLIATAPEGLTKTYGKWSLSGTHLLIVLACDIANNTTLNGKIADVNIPLWIANKIIPTSSSLVDFKGGVRAWNDDASGSQGYDTILRKTDNTLNIVVNNVTATANRHIRIAFDLLIDNE